MEKKKKHIDDLFRDKVGNYREVPPSDAWLDMDKKLDTLVPHVPSGNPFRWLGHVGIVSIIAVMGVSVINKFIGKNKNSELVYNNQTINKVENTTESIIEENSITQTPEVLTQSNDVVIEEVKEKTIHHPIFHDDVLAFGESYSENADKEYVEGVTEIKREDYNIQPTTNLNYSNSISENRNYNVQENIGYHSALQQNKYGSETINNTQKEIENQSSTKENKETKELINSTENVSVIAKISDKKQSPKSNFNRWEFGAKAGYERGFDNSASKSVVFSPYVIYKLSEKVGIMSQPTAKFANAPVRNIDPPASYYNTSGDVSVAAVESYETSVVEGITVIRYNNTKFRYAQSFDSIVKTNTTGGKYTLFELPVLLNYKVGKNIAVYGGINTAYSQLQTVTEKTNTYTGTKTVDVLVKSKETPVAPPANEVINYNGSPYSEYNGPVYPSTNESNVRLGAMVGVNYEYNNRWLIDAMLQKTPAPSNVKNGYNVNAPLSAPSFRVSIGYKIKK